jgi:hypothetical protein
MKKLIFFKKPSIKILCKRVRVSEIKDKQGNYISNSKAMKILRKHERNMQELWDTIKRLNPKIRNIEEGEEIKEKAWTPYSKT